MLSLSAGSVMLTQSPAAASSCYVAVDNPYVLNVAVDIDVDVPVVHAGGVGYCPGATATTTQVCLAPVSVCSGSGRAGEYDGSDVESVCVNGPWAAAASVVGAGPSTGTAVASPFVQLDCGYDVRPIELPPI